MAASATCRKAKSLSIVLDRAAFSEDCARAAVVVSPLTAPADCRPEKLYDEKKLAETGAVGLVWDGSNFLETRDRGADLDRPWAPAPKRARDERVVRPGVHVAPAGADPADRRGGAGACRLVTAAGAKNDGFSGSAAEPLIAPEIARRACQNCFLKLSRRAIPNDFAGASA